MKEAQKSPPEGRGTDGKSPLDNIFMTVEIECHEKTPEERERTGDEPRIEVQSTGRLEAKADLYL